MVKAVVFIILVIIFVFSGVVWAAPLSQGRSAKFEHADKNNDGIVDSKEMNIEKKWEHQPRVKVNRPIEKKYDANADGIIEPAEAKQMLRDKYTLINKHGRVKVDSTIEAQYDTDKNGHIDKKESRAFMEAIN